MVWLAKWYRADFIRSIRCFQSEECRGSLVEWLATEDGCGASTLVFAVARCVTPQDGTILVIDRAFSFHPPAVLPWMSQRHMVIAHPSNAVDEAWSIDQSLQCSGVSVVVAWLGCIHPTAMRRWHLAAQKWSCWTLYSVGTSAVGAFMGRSTNSCSTTSMSIKV